MSLTAFLDLLTPQLAVAGAAALVGAAIRGYSGFGANIIWAPVLALTVGPVEAVAIMAMANILASVPLAISAVRHVQWAETLPIVIGVFLLAPIGVFVLVSADPLILRRTIGGMVLVIGLVLMTGWTYRGPRNVPVKLGVGALAGWIAGLSAVGGPVAVLFLMSAPGEARVQRANNVFAIIMMAPIVLVSLLLRDAISLETVARTAILGVPYFTGQWIGMHLFHVMPDRYYRRAVLALLIVVGASALFL